MQKLTNKYCKKYRCFEIRTDLFNIIDICNGEKFFIFKKLVYHLRKIISSDEKSFTGELVANSYLDLLKEINEEGFLKVIDKKRKTPDAELYIVFTCYRSNNFYILLPLEIKMECAMEDKIDQLVVKTMEIV